MDIVVNIWYIVLALLLAVRVTYVATAQKFLRQYRKELEAQNECIKDSTILLGKSVALLAEAWQRDREYRETVNKLLQAIVDAYPHDTVANAIRDFLADGGVEHKTLQ